VRIIPKACGITPAHMGSFVLIEFAKADSIVHLEHLSTAAFPRDKVDVEAHQRARMSLDQIAMRTSRSDSSLTSSRRRRRHNDRTPGTCGLGEVKLQQPAQLCGVPLHRQRVEGVRCWCEGGR